VNIVFFGDAANEFSNRHFQALEEACRGGPKPPAGGSNRSGGGGRRIVAVVDSPKDGWVSTRQGGSDRSPPFDLRVRELGAALLRPRDPNAKQAVAHLAALRPDLLLAVGYTRRLGTEVLGLARLGAVNLHASLLPAYRGKHPVFWALFHGERSAGLTAHLMDPRIDGGAILYQVRVRTRLTDSVASLYERIMARSVALVSRLLADAEEASLKGRRLQGSRQEEAGSSYFSSPGEAAFRLAWSMPAGRIVHRACSLPGRFWFPLSGGRIYIVEASAESGGPGPGEHSPGEHSPGEHSPGEIIRLGRRHAVVAASGRAVKLVRLAAEERPGVPGAERPAAELLRDRGLRPGDQLVTGRGTAERGEEGG
jgi:methionyl-tRNA formyltransferase